MDEMNDLKDDLKDIPKQHVLVEILNSDKDKKKEKKVNNKKPKAEQINFRVTEKQKDFIYSLANESGLSITDFILNLIDNKVIEKNDSLTVLDNSEVEILKEKLSSKEYEINIFNDYVESIKEQLKIKDEQINSLNERFRNLEILLIQERQQQQQLILKNIEVLEHKEDSRNKSWFSRLFGGKK